MGWMVLKQDKKSIGRVDITDLNNDPLVMFQHKHFVFVALSMAFLFPCMVAGLGWGDWKGGLIYSGILRLFVVQQATFCVNSLAHWLGDQPFDDRNTPRDHVLTALVTLGEGYHNFHHEFPADYRNAIEWHQYDPTKWMIWAWKQVGLASNLKTCRRSIIEKGRVQQMQKQLDKKRATLEWGIAIEDLPLVEWDDFVQRAKDGEALVAIGGVIHNVGSFVKDHPGGKALIASAVGKDATSMFNGGVYDHTNAAHNLLSTMRVGVLRGGVEVECWKRRPVKGEVISSTLSYVG
jgi:stearoyl-CoA desaturase (delta-9 desaturase)